ncbi:hypothetical protein FD18_GL000241 [Lactobacillus taiwanensis DSM 21401]|uniref:Uncharacterized protein n=1 Tax=Lactobacillus taiwanensis TaxID=508451 RepID=A0A256L986_9LACO|nr:hypothetical protein [Lactobacillus taiwanensis]KRM99151.1 hypothetical protein FD18_GL000241 [Lactobacillus taiwanensis DSM 21401]MCR1916335.1 hypothetical protein [Lactobacillus taiwanensis]OYR87110.1 hypothetical protein CBF53_08930 [Lactobacillus taiwanensis]OYR89981.1 hypothetical protein CBF70_09990 [Lactobacillus taiwanensis]OYR91340.1 hypothetical protein CBF59_06495 [Lactobacillus taiwanensis]
MPVGYIPIILLLLIVLVDIIASLKLHKLVKTSDVSNILILGIVAMVIFALKDLSSFSWSSAIATVFMSIVVLKEFYDEYHLQVEDGKDEKTAK